MKKLLASLILSTLLFSSQAFAATTLLPGNEEVKEWTTEKCVDEINAMEDLVGGQDGMQAFFEKYKDQEGAAEVVIEKVMTCAIKTGRIKMWMVPFFVSRALSFIIGIAGLISVLMILVGAFYYIAGGLNEDKEKGKTIITYALGGFALVLLSWAIVNGLLLLLTT